VEKGEGGGSGRTGIRPINKGGRKTDTARVQGQLLNSTPGEYLSTTKKRIGSKGRGKGIKKNTLSPVGEASQFVSTGQGATGERGFFGFGLWSAKRFLAFTVKRKDIPEEVEKGAAQKRQGGRVLWTEQSW